MLELKSILLAEDNPNDIELTLNALAEHNLANEVIVARDGEERLHPARKATRPSSCWTSKCRKSTAWKY